MALLLPATQDIDATVVDELAFLGGTVSDRFDDGRRLFLRARLPMSDEVRPKDIVEGGVAVRTVGREIEVCPYLFRQVCKNGAIMPQVAEARRIELVDFSASTETIETVNDQVREAVRACSASDVFDHIARQVRAATSTEVTNDISQILHFLSLRRMLNADLIDEIVEAFLEEDDRSAFGLMNAVTSVARDQDDPEVRWHLEELGGGVPAMNFPHDRPGGSEVELMVSDVQEQFAVEAVAASSRF
jgi:hypothetical protein